MTGPLAVCSLWHFPGVAPSRLAPSGLPCGVRTFLRGRCPCGSPSLSPAAAPSYTHTEGTPTLYPARSPAGARGTRSGDTGAPAPPTAPPPAPQAPLAHRATPAAFRPARPPRRPLAPAAPRRATPLPGPAAPGWLGTPPAPEPDRTHFGRWAPRRPRPRRPASVSLPAGTPPARPPPPSPRRRTPGGRIHRGHRRDRASSRGK